MLVRDGALVHALLLEVGLDGRPARLELGAGSGMLTLHPEADERSIHGNVVGADGVRPLAFEWSSRHGLDVAGSPIPTLVMLHGLYVTPGATNRMVVPILAIDEDLTPIQGDRVITRNADTWTIEDRGGATNRSISMKRDGVPMLDDEAASIWPLDEPN